MALKDKNGKIYTLTKPNPIVVNQNLWIKDDKLVFHNKVGTIIVLPDETKPIKKEVKLEEVLPKPEVKPVEKTEVDINEDKIQVWCLPASYKEYKDDLYGEKYNRVRYGNKFLLEAIIVDQSDISISMWVNTRAVTEGSVLFPRTQDKRWWRVERIKQQDDGYIVYATISDYQPKFSD